MTRHIIDKEILRQVFSEHYHQKHIDQLKDKISISIDSRTIIPNDIFFAIRGEIDDGHNYIEDAYEKGASLIIAEKTYEKQVNTSSVIFVDNTLEKYSDLARLHLHNLSVKKIAITGSNGKTTSKEMLKAALVKVLGEKQVYASVGNKNNHFGVPISALEVTSEHRIAIFEMGMNHAGEIASLCSIIEPDIAVITNISFAHEGNFIDGIEGVERAKGEVFQSLNKDTGYAVINLDDPRVTKEAIKSEILHRISFGHSDGADIKILSHEPFSMAFHSQKVSISVCGEEPLLFSIPMAGAHHAQNAACALAVVKALNLSVKEAASGLLDMAKTRGRMAISASPKGYLLIDDGYNANPTSMAAGILATRDFPAKRRIAAIGAMGELGDKSAHHHFELGQLLASHFDYLFICGALALNTVKGALKNGLALERIIFRNSSFELIEPLKSLLKDGDLLFIKGSLSANMQTIVKGLTADN